MERTFRLKRSSREKKPTHDTNGPATIWVVGKIMVPCRVLNVIRHLIFRVPKKGP